MKILYEIIDGQTMEFLSVDDNLNFEALKIKQLKAREEQSKE